MMDSAFHGIKRKIATVFQSKEDLSSIVESLRKENLELKSEIQVLRATLRNRL